MSFAAKEAPRISVPILKVELRIAYQASLLTIPPEILTLAFAILARVIGTLNPCSEELDIKEPGVGGVKDCLHGLFLQLVKLLLTFNVGLTGLWHTLIVDLLRLLAQLFKSSLTRLSGREGFGEGLVSLGLGWLVLFL